MNVSHCPSSRGSGGAVSPPAGPGQSPGGGPEGEAPGSSESPAFYSTKQRTKSHPSGAFSLVLHTKSNRFFLKWYISSATASVIKGKREFQAQSPLVDFV